MSQIKAEPVDVAALRAVVRDAVEGLRVFALPTTAQRLEDAADALLTELAQARETKQRMDRAMAYIADVVDSVPAVARVHLRSVQRRLNGDYPQSVTLQADSQAEFAR